MPPFEAADLADTDATVEVVTWLSQHPKVLAEIGDDPTRVRGTNEPPYPRLRVLGSPGGSDRGLRWLLAPEVTIEALGDLDGSPGPVALRRLLYVALAALTELPEAPTEPGRPVVTAIVSTGAGGWSPLPSGQPRMLARVAVSLHPPQQP